MKELRFEIKLIRLVYATLNGSKSRLKEQNEYSEAFVTNTGLRQGNALSTLLFNAACNVPVNVPWKSIQHRSWALLTI